MYSDGTLGCSPSALCMTVVVSLPFELAPSALRGVRFEQVTSGGHDDGPS